MNQYMDQSILVHLSGARGFQDHKIEWSVPLASHKDFAKVMVNRVKAPTKNRHLVAGAGSVAELKVNAGELVISTTDTLSMDVLDSVRQWSDSIPLPPPPVEFDNDQAATDSPIRVFLASPAQYSAFATDPAFRSFQANAHARARLAKDHPLFLGDAGLWNGILILKNPKAIRFYAGDEIKYCAAYDSEVESSCVVPSSFTDKFAVDRGLLLGGQVAGGLLLGEALLLLALALQLLLAPRFLFRAQLLLLGAPRGLGLGRGDRGLEALHRRVAGVGLLDQRQQAPGLDEVGAITALLGRDHGHRQQVDQRAGHAGVGRLLVAQREVVLHRVVAAGRIQPAFLVGLGRGLAQLVRAQRGDFRRDHRVRRRRGGGGRRARLAGGIGGGRVLLARRQRRAQREGEGRGHEQPPLRPLRSLAAVVGHHVFP